MIRYKEIVNESVVDGLGIRVTAFLQGCPRHCDGCHNPGLLPIEGGIEAGEKEFAEMLLSKITPLHRGITFSGGDPLVQAEALLKVIFLVKRRSPKLDIWVYTGFTFEEVKHLPVLSVIDFLVDGPFIKAQKDLQLPFRGSDNQRIIDVSRTLTAGWVIEADIKSGYSKAV